MPKARCAAQIVQRLLGRHGTLPGPEALKVLAKTDPQALGPRALDRFLGGFEAPEASEGMAVDRMIRETLMSTIYREIRFSLKRRSFKIISSKRLMVPFWVKRKEDGDPEWMVDAYLGRFIPPDETSPGA